MASLLLGCGLLENAKTCLPGAQTERRGGVRQVSGQLRRMKETGTAHVLSLKRRSRPNLGNNSTAFFRFPGFSVPFRDFVQRNSSLLRFILVHVQRSACRG